MVSTPARAGDNLYRDNGPHVDVYEEIEEIRTIPALPHSDDLQPGGGGGGTTQISADRSSITTGH